MRGLDVGRCALFGNIAAALLAGCGGSQSPIGTSAATPQGVATTVRRETHWPIRHVIVVVQQNRSFDNLFAGFPGANYRFSGPCAPAPWCKHRRARLEPITLQTNGQAGAGVALPDSNATFNTEYDNAKSDGFDLIRFGTSGDGAPAKLYPYAYVVRAETKPYWDLAHQYALADNMFSTEQAGSFAASLVLVASTTSINDRDDLWVVGVTSPGGCDAPRGTATILSNGRYGPKPCFNQFRTMASTLDAAQVSWKYYTLPCTGSHADIGCSWDAFEAIKYVREGNDWERNVSVPNTNFFSDVRHDKLPAVSWITPTLADSDDPVSGSDTGPAWVTSIVSAVKRSRYWKSTAVIVIWGDWGGYYDEAAPPLLDPIGLSFRVPMLVISPYAKRGYVSPTQYELASILKFIEQVFDLAPLGPSVEGYTDSRASSIDDMFDFK